MAEAINTDAKTETINEESVVPLQPMLSQNKTQFAPDKFFASLNQLGKTLDSEVSQLETVVGRQVSRALSSRQDGEFAAPIADDMHDELQDLNRLLDEKLSFVHENCATMDSFIDHTLQGLEEIRQDVVRVQEYAAKYGYKATEDATFKPLDREGLEAEAVAQERAEEIIRVRKESNGILSSNANITALNGDSKKPSRPNTMDELEKDAKRISEMQVPGLPEENIQTNTPKLIEIGLSKDTLRQIGFTFKEATEKNSGFVTKKENGNNKLNNQKSTKLQKSQEESVSSDGDSPPISILKGANQGAKSQPNLTLESSIANTSNICNVIGEDTTITSDIGPMMAQSRYLSSSVNNASNTSMEVSRVEISPGLIVRRPSSKKRQHKQDPVNLNDRQKDCNPVKAPVSIDVDPTLPHNTSENDTPLTSADNSPVMPSLKTVDVQKFLQALNQKGNKPTWVEDNHKEANECSDRHNNSPSNKGGKSTSQPIEINASTGVHFGENTLSPEMPVLATVNLANYLSKYNSSENTCNNEANVGSAGNPHQDKNLSTNYIKTNAENQTPDPPELATISPRSLHAMSVGRNPIQLLNTTEIMVPEAAKVAVDDSPVCPILSQSSMELLNKYKNCDGF